MSGDSLVIGNYHLNLLAGHRQQHIRLAENTDRNREGVHAKWQRQLSPNSVHNVLVPTALERKGDFSQSKNFLKLFRLHGFSEATARRKAGATQHVGHTGMM